MARGNPSLARDAGPFSAPVSCQPPPANPFSEPLSWGPNQVGPRGIGNGGILFPKRELNFPKDRERIISPKFFRPKFFHGRPRGMSVPKCLFFQDLEGLTEVFGGTSAGMSGPKLPLWAEFSFLKRMIKGYFSEVFNYVRNQKHLTSPMQKF